MKRAMQAYLNALSIIGIVFHELAHLLMAIVLYPFGAKLTGVKIVGGPTENGEWIMEGRVMTERSNRVCDALVAAAPVIIGLIVFCLGYYWICIFWKEMWLSPEDRKIYKEQFQRTRPPGISGVEIAKQLNACLDRNLNQTAQP